MCGEPGQHAVRDGLRRRDPGRHARERRGSRWTRPLRASVLIVCAVVLGVAIAGVSLAESRQDTSWADPPGTLAAVLPTVSTPSAALSSPPRSPRTVEGSGASQPRVSVPRAICVPESGSGTFDRAQIPGGPRTADVTYRIEAEQNLPISARSFSKVVRRTLSDQRSWSAGDPAALAPTNDAADLRIVLATPQTTDRLCAPLQTRGRVSCRNGSNVVINAWRWVHGSTAYGSDIDGYRRYVINHEVGHLGNGHEECPSAGALAPVMLQQTLGLQGCRSNPWPARADLVGK